MKYFDEEWTDATTEYEEDECDAAGDPLEERGLWDPEHTKRTKLYLLITMLVVGLLAAGTAAWYRIRSQREIDSQKTDVMTPYFLYLLNPGDLKSLALTIGNIHPGEIKREIICVSNRKEDAESNREINKNSNFAYELELAYTQNLPVNYRVYPLAKDPDGDLAVKDEKGNAVVIDGEKLCFKKLGSEALAKASDESALRQRMVYGDDLEKIINIGKYDTYKEGTDGEELKLTTTVSGNDVDYELDYYLIEITWQEGITFSDYSKETDLFYVIVKALQPRPGEKE